LNRVAVQANKVKAEFKKDLVTVDGLLKQKKHVGFNMIDE
jgi:hypothetical protein